MCGIAVKIFRGVNMKKTLLMLFFIVSAIILGSLLGDAVHGTEALGWLAHDMSFSFQPGTFLNFNVLSLTFGITVSINVAQIILIGIGLYAFYKIAPKLITSK